MKIIVIIALFLYIAGLLIAGNHNLHLIDPEERFEFGKLYYAWTLKAGKNLGTITGNAIKLDWTPETTIPEKNTTNKSK
ncbi:hypothetical protein EXS73_02080 [Candidatus Pacearchaeota archaeon]|nr:hypothetical protein [Candidatus Pacearchaeota archaeon]